MGLPVDLWQAAALVAIVGGIGITAIGPGLLGCPAPDRETRQRRAHPQSPDVDRTHRAPNTPDARR